MTKPTMSASAAARMVKGCSELDTACFAAMRGADAMRRSARALPEGSPERAKVEALGIILERIYQQLDGKPSPEGNAYGLANEIRTGLVTVVPDVPEPTGFYNDGKGNMLPMEEKLLDGKTRRWVKTDGEGKAGWRPVID